ncbi:MAG: hypothetical protein JNM50_13465 [Chromatiales bacterium]|mgnify:FL=1|jgi:hypothetical protein|nr:hypothetical protein [Chromatiales bacterium]
MRCSMTGQPLRDTSDGIYDDGEWISWDWINGHIADQELRGEFPNANLQVVKIFQDLVALAEAYKFETGRYLQIWGELGELYAEIKFGVVRHRPGTQGSDGRIGNDWVEVKTISPEKLSEAIQVKRAGNFNKLLVVKISEDFEFEARLIDRKRLRKGKGKHAKTQWSEHPAPEGNDTAP